jgi:hypothetical protein
VVAFFGSMLALVVVVGAVWSFGKRRPLGTPLTWGEAMVAGIALFAIFILAYGIVPDTFLKWANGNTLNWRSDIFGIPIGPFGKLTPNSWENHWFSHSRNVLWPDGITFWGRGRVTLSKQTIRDIIAATIYIVFLLIHGFLWAGWQRRGKKAAALTAIETSSTYGRPLVKKG